jgi:hypothetical protein
VGASCRMTPPSAAGVLRRSRWSGRLSAMIIPFSSHVFSIMFCYDVDKDATKYVVVLPKTTQRYEKIYPKDLQIYKID